MDPGTGLTILGSAIGSAKLLEKILGPTAEYLGGGLKIMTEKSIKNLLRIFTISKNKLGERLDEDGGVPPSILKGILEEGAFCEDEVSAEYFGGVLASSKSNISRDDRGKSVLSLISRLSSYQIRAHYIFYILFKKLYDGIDIEYLDKVETQKLKLHIPDHVFSQAMDFTDREILNSYSISSHILQGLQRENLIDENWGIVTAEKIKSKKYNINIAPALSGFELFLWSQGLGQLDLIDFLNPKIHFSKIKEINIPIGFSGNSKISQKQKGIKILIVNTKDKREFSCIKTGN